MIQRYILRSALSGALILLAAWASARAGEASNSIRRIVSTSPSATEILYALGVFDRVVAVSDYDTYPPEVRDKPRVGGWQNTNLERLVSLQPDLVILDNAQRHLLEQKLKSLGIQHVEVSTRNLADIFAAIRTVGEAVGRQARAAEVVGQTKAALAGVRERVRERPRPRVLVVVDRVPGTLREIYVATPGSFLAELVDMAGGEALAAPTTIGYGRLSKEKLLEMNPEIILDISQIASTNRMPEDWKAVWAELPEIAAVRANRVYLVRESYTVHASPLVAKTAKLFGRLIHPEAFPSEKP